MTNKDIRNEWEKHFGDSMPENELNEAFTKVMSSADRREKAQSVMMRVGLRQKIRRIALTCTSAAAMLIFVPWITLRLNDRIASEESAVAESPRLCEVSTHNGETREIILPDSTRITLNAGSVLIYPEAFSAKERSVYLSGEAVFEVTHSDELPFMVNTSDLTIRVHGTTFNVNAYPESRNTSATLCEGSISATLKNNGESILMIPEERLSYDRETGKSTISRVNPSEDTAWKRGDMCFRSENIHAIVKAIERKYGINTYVTSGKYDDMILTAKFVQGETMEQMLGAICKLVPGMKYSIVNGCVYIR